MQIVLGLLLYILSSLFHMFKTEVKAKINENYFQTRGAYYMRKYEYFGISRAKVGVRIIRGCVLYAENYGSILIRSNAQLTTKYTASYDMGLVISINNNRSNKFRVTNSETKARRFLVSLRNLCCG